LLKKEKQFLMSLALGDGYVRKRGESYSIAVSHCEKQKEYLIYKAERLSQIIGKKVEIHGFQVSGYPTWRFEVSNDYFHFVRNWLYREGNKTISICYLRKLSDEGVAIWYMDDGSLVAKRRNGKIHAFDLTVSTYCSEEEASICIQFFKERYDTNFTIKRNKRKFSIRCGTKEAKKLLYHLMPYIHPIMRYKTFQTAST